MLKVLLVDDEPLARTRLKRLLGQCRGVQLVAEADNVEHAWEAIHTHQPQVVLLDIAMPDGDGLSLAARLRTLSQAPVVIFTTAYEEHALSAFGHAAVDYLVKPVRQERLQEAIERAQRFWAGQQHEPRWLRARVGSRVQLIALDDIICCVAEDKYTTVHYEQGETVVDISLAKLEQEFTDFFLRIHRSALVARHRLHGLENQQGRHLLSLRGSSVQLEVSRRHLPELRRYLKEHS
jgi:two-component system response regulator AlgR